MVKADGYAHGAVRVARAALDAGAEWLAVAVVDEAVELREAGIDASILLLSEPVADATEAVVEHSITPALYSRPCLEALGRAADRARRDVDVHVKVDTGMHRIGVAPDDAGPLAAAVRALPRVALGGVFTHLAVADGDSTQDREFTELQLRGFERALDGVRSQGIEPGLRHAANSAATIAYPPARYDLVRTGIAIYGEVPSPTVGDALAQATGGRGLRPVRSLHSRVVALRSLAAGERPSYGRVRPLPLDSVVATVPIGYADGVPRRFFHAGGEVLIRGRRRPLAGVMTMDQMVVDCGPDGDVEVGDEVVLIGAQGGERVTVSEWAGLLGTVNHEVLTLLGARVPRVAAHEAKALRDGGVPGAPGSR